MKIPCIIDVKINFDKLGAFTSSVCLVHCILLPIVISAMPFLAISFLNLEMVEIVLLSFAGLFGISAICFGYKKHKQISAPFLISAGLFILVIGRITHHETMNSWHTAMMVLAGLLLVSGHFVNNKLCNESCDRCSHL